VRKKDLTTTPHLRVPLTQSSLSERFFVPSPSGRRLG
jgi:hypothetical protein